MPHINGHFISSACDPEVFLKLLEDFEQETPHCPWNKNAAEHLSKPEEKRTKWHESYAEMRQSWADNNVEEKYV